MKVLTQTPPNATRGNRPSRHVLAGLIFGAVALSALSGNASADDGKAYSGAECQPSGANQAASYGNAGYIANTSGDRSLYVKCTIVRDSMTEGWKELVLHFDDQHPTRSVACTFNRVNEQGRIELSTTVRSRGTGRQTARIKRGTCSWPWACVAGPTVPKAIYVLACSIPPHHPDEPRLQSKIDRYTFLEK